jgi:adhesin/invasin
LIQVALLRSRSAFLVPSALAALLSACGGADLTLPGDAQPSHIDIVTGDEQAGIAGSALAQPLVVKVTDQIGRPVAGLRVDFTVQSGDGGLTPATAQTDTGGRATSVWTLGVAAGTQEVEARAVVGGASDDLVVSFSATAVAGSGSLLVAVSGDDQSGAVNSVLPDSLVVRATDAGGNPVSGVTVHWSAQGGGTISPETVVTGDNGQAAAERVLGPGAGQQTAEAAADGLAGSPVSFVHTGLATAPTALVKVSGDEQTAPAGFEVAEDLVVKLTDADGNGVGGRSVTWVVASGGGTTTPLNSTTDPSGFARTRWTLGTSAGANSLNAVFSGVPPVPFSATASADVPAKLALVSGNGQSGVVGQPLGNPLVVKVTDANDNPVENVSVSWAAVGGGSVASGTSGTNAQGLAQMARTLGSTPGTYTTTASVTDLTGSPITFTSTASAGQAAKVVIVTQPGTPVRNGDPLPTQPVVQVQDAQGNNVGPAGRGITASIATGPGGASLVGDVTRETDGGGRATFSGLGIAGPIGVYTIRFSSGSLTAAVSGAVSVTAGDVSGARSSVSANPDQIAVGGSSSITVTARDAGGNPVAGATVVLSATGSGNNLTQPPTTDGNGVATGTFSSSGTGPHTITATIAGVAVGDNAVVTVAAGPVSPSQSSVNADPDQIPAGGSSTVTITARDAAGNPIAGSSVSLQVTGGGTLTAPGPTNASGVTTSTFSSTALGPHTVSATIDGVAITDVATVTVAAGEASRIVIATQPDDNVQNGAQLATQPVVQVQDDQGNNVGPAGRVITAALASGPGGAQLGGDVTRETDGSGRAAFTDLSISGPVGSYTIRFSSGSLTTVTSSTITVTTGPVSASQSTVNANPDQIAASTGQSTITVTARDASGNLIQGAGVELQATGSGNNLGNPGSTNSSGVATATFSATGVGQHTITARINGVAITDNAVVSVTAGPVSASQSSVSSSADQITAGGSSATITITARDAGGNPVSGASVQLNASGGGNTFSNPSLTNASGVTTATYTSTQSGSHVITATINGVAITDNATVTVQPGPASSLSFTVQPSGTRVDQVITPAVVVSVEDQFGNPTSGTVVMSLDPPILATGNLHGTLSVAATGGSATFSDLSVDAAAFLAYRLVATLGDITETSAGFLVTP